MRKLFCVLSAVFVSSASLYCEGNNYPSVNFTLNETKAIDSLDDEEIEVLCSDLGPVHEELSTPVNLCKLLTDEEFYCHKCLSTNIDDIEAWLKSENGVNCSKIKMHAKHCSENLGTYRKCMNEYVSFLYDVLEQGCNKNITPYQPSAGCKKFDETCHCMITTGSGFGLCVYDY